jgi:colanic acid/amylovoran biosynthesis glycosyltransferase
LFSLSIVIDFDGNDMRLDKAHAKSVGIFRLQLFKTSETFITEQAHALKRYNPIFIGRRFFGAGPEGAAVALGEQAGVSRSKLAILTRSASPYQAALQGRKVDLLHAHFGADGLYALGLAHRLNIPLITTLHGMDVTTSDRSFLKSGRPALVHYALGRRRLQERGALFICVSEFIRDCAIAIGFPKDRIVVHHVGTRIPEEESSANTKPPTIVHVARLVEKKGTGYLLEAAANLRRRNLEFHLDIIGDGPRRPELEAQARANDLSRSVSFHGVLPHREVLSRLRSASVLALPSVRAANGDAEGLGMVLLEASSLGVPVVGSRSGGIPEAIRDGETGYLVPERDSTALADSIYRLLSEPELRKKFGSKGRQFMRQEFDIVTQSEVLENIYDQILAGRKMG